MKIRNKFFVIAAALLTLSACGDNDTASAPEPVRGLKSVVIKETASSSVRLFPSVLSPANLTTLSFEVGGQVQNIDLRVGQTFEKDEVLAKLDPRELLLSQQSAKAALTQVEANTRNAEEDMKRKQQLLEKGVVTKAVYDQAKNLFEAEEARLLQTQKQLDIATRNLSKSELKAPYDGVVAKVPAQSFSTISPGAAVVSIYQEDDYEVSFSVPFDVSSQIAIGKKVKLRLSDLPDRELDGYIKESGASADKLSEFPVVVRLEGKPTGLKSGMAVEVAIELQVIGAEEGFIVPLSVLALDSIPEEQPGANDQEPQNAEIFVYDPQTETVNRRAVKIGGIRQNSLLITNGVEEGERVASAGVSFLRDGMKVKLLEANQ